MGRTPMKSCTPRPNHSSAAGFRFKPRPEWDQEDPEGKHHPHHPWLGTVGPGVDGWDAHSEFLTVLQTGGLLGAELRSAGGSNLYLLLGSEEGVSPGLEEEIHAWCDRNDARHAPPLWLQSTTGTAMGEGSGWMVVVGHAACDGTARGAVRQVRPNRPCTPCLPPPNLGMRWT